MRAEIIRTRIDSNQKERDTELLVPSEKTIAALDEDVSLSDEFSDVKSLRDGLKLTKQFKKYAKSENQ